MRIGDQRRGAGPILRLLACKRTKLQRRLRRRHRARTSRRPGRGKHTSRTSSSPRRTPRSRRAPAGNGLAVPRRLEYQWRAGPTRWVMHGLRRASWADAAAGRRWARDGIDALGDDDRCFHVSPPSAFHSHSPRNHALVHSEESEPDHAPTLPAATSPWPAGARTSHIYFYVAAAAAAAATATLAAAVAAGATFEAAAAKAAVAAAAAAAVSATAQTQQRRQWQPPQPPQQARGPQHLGAGCKRRSCCGPEFLASSPSSLNLFRFRAADGAAAGAVREHGPPQQRLPLLPGHTRTGTVI